MIRTSGIAVASGQDGSQSVAVVPTCEATKWTSEYLCHAGPGFTLPNYARLMKDSAERTRRRSTRCSTTR
ncbi:hypothetical protein [Terrabacter terrigena]|uniref:Uncharacterized protein n=1 Tax=Terrabacter terrigena TaxID=574718 RepID=A0ABW3N4C8_9MICO